MSNNSSKAAISDAAKKSRQVTQGAINTVANVSFIVRHPLITALVIVVLVVSILVNATAAAQMDKVFNLNAIGDTEIKLSEKEMEESLTDEGAISVQTTELLTIVDGKKEKSFETTKAELTDELKRKGFDKEKIENITGSLSYNNVITEEGETAEEDTSKKEETTKTEEDTKTTKADKKNTYKEFDLSIMSEKSSRTFTYEAYNQGWNTGTVQYRLLVLNKDKVRIDSDGFAKYKTDKDTEDYMIALGSYFGNPGNRYEITFSNGTVATFIKADAKADEHTDSNNFAHAKDGSVIEFLVDENKLSLMNKIRGNCYYAASKTFKGSIKRIKLLEGNVAGQIQKVNSISSYKIISAFSIALDNKQYLKNKKDEKDSVLTRFFENIKGKKISLSWNNKKSRVNFKRELKKRINKWLDNGGSFYEYKIEGEKAEIVEKPIEDIMYDLFELDPDAKYINSGEQCTNKEAVDTLAENTQKLIYGESYNGEDVVLISANGDFAYPASQVYQVTSEFGYRESPTPGATSNHKGIDLGFPSGTSVLATADGTVTIAGYYGGYGNLVEIKHANGYVSRYGHLNSVSVKEGMHVSQGMQIGISGSTGVSTGPHLHFEIMHNGEQVDPLKYIEQKTSK